MLFLGGQAVQVGVVNGEVLVVLLQDPCSCTLDTQLANVIPPAFPVGRPEHLDAVLGRQVSEFQENHSQVMDEQQGVDQTHSEVDDGTVLHLLRVLDDAHDVEQPEGEREHQDEHRHQSSEDENSGHGGLGLPEEERPRPQQEDEELEREADEEAVALGVAQRRVVLQLDDVQARDQHHRYGAEESQEGHEGAQSRANVSLAREGHAGLLVSPDYSHVLEGLGAHGGVPRDGGGVVSPVVVLREDLHLDHLAAHPPVAAYSGRHLADTPSSLV